jgi:UDP-glucose 4-epimerase
LNILITGATGFIGQQLIKHLLSQKRHSITALVRNQNHSLPSSVNTILVPSIDGATDFSTHLSSIDIVIHLAARVHKMKDLGRSSYDAYRSINTEGTVKLAEQAATAGVKRFIYLSSIKVNGETTIPAHPFTADDTPHPTDPYAVSKYRAEVALQSFSKKNKLEYVIIRPPLVYGPGVKANFEKLITLIYRRIPLPLGAVKNQRSLVSIDNLVGLITHCISHPRAANQVFLVSDDNDLSTTDLLQLIGKTMNRPVRLLPIPEKALCFISKLFGKKNIAQRLLGNLQIDISKTKNLLDWHPTKTPEEGIKETTQKFLQEKNIVEKSAEPC